MDKFNIAWIPVLKSWQYSKMEDVEIPAKKNWLGPADVCQWYSPCLAFRKP